MVQEQAFLKQPSEQKQKPTSSENRQFFAVVYVHLCKRDAPDADVVQQVARLKGLNPELARVEGRVTAMLTHDGVANFTVAALANYDYSDNFIPEISFYHIGGVRPHSAVQVPACGREPLALFEVGRQDCCDTTSKRPS